LIPAIVGGAVLRTLVVEAVFRSGLRTGHHRDAGGAGVDVQDVHPLRLPLGGGISGLALSRRRPLLCEDSDTDQRVDAAACRKVGVKSMIVTPLLHGPEVVGVLKVVSARPRQFTTQDQLALELLAAPFDATISNAGRLQTTYSQQRPTRSPDWGNRSHVLHALDLTLQRQHRHGGHVAVIFLDLDRFKAVNDHAFWTIPVGRSLRCGSSASSIGWSRSE